VSIEYPPGMSLAPREPDDDEIRFKRRALRSLILALSLIGLLLLTCTVVTTVAVVLIRHQQVQSHSTLVNAATAAHNATRTAHDVHSCVTPGEGCFERAQHQTATVVAGLTAGNQRAAAAAASCAVTLPHPTFPAVYRCELERLAVQQHH
jgi:hypothetical protein